MNRPKQWKYHELYKIWKNFVYGAEWLTSIRLMVALAIADKAFNPWIKTQLITLFEQGNEQETPYKTLYAYDKCPDYGEIKQLIDAEDREAYKTNDMSRYNVHHIIPQQWYKNQIWHLSMIEQCNAKNKNISQWTIVLPHQKIRQSLYQQFPLTTTLTHNGWFFGADLTCNLIGMTHKRHNKWLNIKYDNNMLPHHMMLAELMYADSIRSSNEKLAEIKKSIIALLAHKPIEQLYNRECFVIVTDTGKILNPHDTKKDQ